MKCILISVNDSDIDKIINGNKRCIYLKEKCKKNIEKVLMYNSQSNKIVGSALIKNIESGNPVNIWENTKNSSKVGKKIFKDLYADEDILSAVKIKHIEMFDLAKELSDYDIQDKPKEFCYVEDEFTLTLDFYDNKLNEVKDKDDEPFNETNNEEIILKEQANHVDDKIKKKTTNIEKHNIKEEKWFSDVVKNKSSKLYIYPKDLSNYLKISLDKAFEMLESYEEQLNSEIIVKCPYCNKIEEQHYNSYGSLPLTMNCSHCKKTIDHIITNSLIIYVLK